MDTREVYSQAHTADDVAELIFGHMNASMELATIVLGDRLNLYRTIRDLGPVTAASLSQATQTDERYIREWLEQQAIAGFLIPSDSASDDARTYTIDAAHAEAFTNMDSLAFAIPLAQIPYGFSTVFEQLTECFRTGAGISFADFGADTRDGIALINRTMFINQLGSEWFPAIPALQARLSDATTPARVADIGCGTGWSSIAMAAAYPHISIDGVDSDPSSIEMATSNAKANGVDDRIRWHLADAAQQNLAGPYDLVCAFECLHDMSNPVGALTTMKGLVARDGFVLIVDERVPDAFSVPGNDIDRYLYSCSVLHCLPAGRAEEPSAATGTIIRPHIMTDYAMQAGYSQVELLDIENIYWNFYLLHRT